MTLLSCPAYPALSHNNLQLYSKHSTSPCLLSNPHRQLSIQLEPSILALKLSNHRLDFFRTFLLLSAGKATKCEAQAVLGVPAPLPHVRPIATSHSGVLQALSFRESLATESEIGDCVVASHLVCEMNLRLTQISTQETYRSSPLNPSPKHPPCQYPTPSLNLNIQIHFFCLILLCKDKVS